MSGGENPNERYTAHGMSLREWFAGQALAATLQAFTGNGWHNPNDYQIEHFAKTAWRCADAMLAERAKREEQGR